MTLPVGLLVVLNIWAWF